MGFNFVLRLNSFWVLLIDSAGELDGGVDPIVRIILRKNVVDCNGFRRIEICLFRRRVF